MENVFSMSAGQKIGKAMELSLPMLLPEAKRQVEAMLTPTSIAIISGGLVLWAGSHLFGAGEILDVALVGLGAVTIGMGAITGVQEMVDFATTAIDARTEGDLSIAAQHFARAVDVLGITFISALLLRQSAKAVWARGMPKWQPAVRVGPPPPPGFKPSLIYTMKQLIDGKGNVMNGTCSIYGDIKIWLGNSFKEQQHHLLHELGHRIFAPKFGPLREFRATVGMSAYLRSAWLQFLEEAFVEARATFIQKGFGEALLSVEFPIKNGYVTVSQLVEEAIALENIVVGGLKYGVYVNEKLYSIAQQEPNQSVAVPAQ